MHLQGFVVLAAVLSLLGGCGDAGEKAAAPPQTARTSEDVPKGKLPEGVVPTHYRLALSIFPETERFSGRTSIDVTLGKPRTALYLHGRDLNVTRAEIVAPDGTVVSARYAQVDPSGVAQLTFAREIPAGKATLVMDYDAPFSTSLAGLYKVELRGESYAFSQLEAIQARRVFPSFDEPRFKTPFDLVITVRQDHEIVSNTKPEREEGAGEGNKRVTFRTTPKLPTYLLAFAVGPLDIVLGPDIPANAFRRAPVPLRGVTAHGKGDQMNYALSGTPEIVQIMERYFGLPYPYDKLDLIAAPDFAPGAMENAGAIVYRETLMLMDESAPLAQRRRHAYVHAHELAHQWFGDLVTPMWWEDIWLNESFATWLGHRATAEWFPDGEYERGILNDGLAVMELDSLGSARRIAEPVTDSNGIANAFDGISYSKGAAVLAMFENYLGQAVFRDGVRLYMKRFADKNAASKDFLQALADGAKRPEVVASFSSFLNQPGVPLVRAEASCANGEGSVNLSQSSYTPIGAEKKERLWRIPVCLRGTGGGEKTCTVLETAEKEIKAEAACKGALVPNAGGTGYYRFAMDETSWRNLVGAFATLGPSEQLMFIANADAAFRAGLLPAPLYLDVLSAGARTGAWDSVREVADILERLDETALPDAARTGFQTYARLLLKPRWDAVGTAPRPGEKAADSLMREGLAWFLTRTVRDVSVRAAFARSGRIYVQSRGNDAGGLSPDLLSVALWAYVAHDGAAAAEEARTALEQSNNAEYRQSLVFALSAARDDASLEKIYAAILSDGLRVNESTMLLSYLLGDPDRREGAWTWTKSHIDELEKRFTPARMWGVIRGLSGVCSQELRDDVEGFFNRRLKDYEGAPRQLALALEAADRCIAFKNAKSAELARAVAVRR